MEITLDQAIELTKNAKDQLAHSIGEIKNMIDDWLVEDKILSDRIKQRYEQ